VDKKSEKVRHILLHCCQMIASLSRSHLAIPRYIQSVRGMSSITESVKNRLVEALTASLNPSHLEIINESHMHSVPKDSETHFRVIVVSDKFSNQLPVQRHRTVYAITKNEMRAQDANPSSPTYFHQIHALAIVAKTPSEWAATIDTEILKKSPTCLGGSKKELGSNMST
jgi:stress-induced morphogen